MEIGFKYVLQSASSFYKKEDHNIAFLTLYQSPMIAALNSGIVYMPKYLRQFMLQKIIIRNKISENLKMADFRHFYSIWNS